MASPLFTSEQVEIIRRNPLPEIIYTPHPIPDVEFDEYIASAASDRDAMYNFRAVLSSLAVAAPAYDIALTGSDENLADKLFKFAEIWTRQAEFPAILRPKCASLLDKVVSNASDLDIWTAVAQLIAFDSSTLTTIQNVPSHTRIPSDTSSVLRDLQIGWNNLYLPHSLGALQSLVQQYQRLNIGQYYAKTLVFVQSSGMGKSRLADAFGQKCPMINFILREERTTGFPPTDHEILSFLRQKPPDKLNMTYLTGPPEKSNSFPERMVAVVWNHTLAVALLQASFEIFNTWVESQSYTAMDLDALANGSRTEMAPLQPESNDDGNSGQRSKNRVKFCEAIVERAGKIAAEAISDDNWIKKFRNEEPSKVHHELESKESSNRVNNLRTAAKNLIDNLQQTQRGNNSAPYLVIVFDEASSLMRRNASDEPHTGLYVALNRIISCLKVFPVWSFFLSTESLIGQLVPPSNAKPTGNYLVDSSARRVLDQTKPPLKRFPPFVALQLDVEERRRMLNPDTRKAELRKPLSHFAEQGHMALFGRPLWYAYQNPEEMNRLAKLKLLGGKQLAKFNPMNEDHVFAALSFRISLDVCLQNPTSVSLTRTAVNSFMRVVISMDQDTGMMDTLTPSEPVLAKAAMEHLCDEANWTNSIRTLTQQLLETGLIDKGHKGELYARLVLILAHDWVRWAKHLQTSTSESVQESASQPVQESASESVPKFEPTFTVLDLLTALYGENHLEQIQSIPERICLARMNFTHFVPAHDILAAEVIPELCHDLLRRSAAMQLTFREETFDLLIPIYYGDENEDFKPSECGVILVQVKNRKKASTLDDIFKENFIKVSPSKDSPNPGERDPAKPIRKKPKFVFKNMANPILFLLFDLGVIRSDQATSPLVQISQGDSGIAPEFWAIHSRGHDEAVFGCLERMDRTDASQQFFVSMPKGESLADQLARRNRTFFELRRSYRHWDFDPEDGGNEADNRAERRTEADARVEGKIKEAEGVEALKSSWKSLKSRLPFRRRESGEESSKSGSSRKGKNPVR